MSRSIGISLVPRTRRSAMLLGLIAHTAMAQSPTSPGLEGTSWNWSSFRAATKRD